MAAQIACNQIAFLGYPARHLLLAIRMPERRSPRHSGRIQLMKVCPDAELPALSRVLEGFYKRKRRAIRRVAISAVMDKYGSGLPFAEGIAHLSQSGWLAVLPGK